MVCFPLQLFDHSPLFFIYWHVLLAVATIEANKYCQTTDINKKIKDSPLPCRATTAAPYHNRHFNSHGARKSIVYGNQFQFDEIIIFYTVKNGNLICCPFFTLTFCVHFSAIALFMRWIAYLSVWFCVIASSARHYTEKTYTLIKCSSWHRADNSECCIVIRFLARHSTETHFTR